MSRDYIILITFIIIIGAILVCSRWREIKEQFYSNKIPLECITNEDAVLLPEDRNENPKCSSYSTQRFDEEIINNASYTFINYMDGIYSASRPGVLDDGSNSSIRRRTISFKEAFPKGFGKTNNGNTQYTVSFWLYLQNIDINTRNILRITNGNKTNGSNLSTVEITPNDSSIKIKVSTDNYYTSEKVIPSGYIPVKDWIHITFIIIDNTLNVFIGGEKIYKSVLQGKVMHPSINKDTKIHIAEGVTKGVVLAKLKIFSVAVPQNYIRYVLRYESPTGMNAVKINNKSNSIEGFVNNSDRSNKDDSKLAVTRGYVGVWKGPSELRKLNGVIIPLPTGVSKILNARTLSYQKYQNSVLYLSGIASNLSESTKINIPEGPSFLPSHRYFFINIPSINTKSIIRYTRNKENDRKSYATALIDLTVNGIIKPRNIDDSRHISLDGIKLFTGSLKGTALDYKIDKELCWSVKIELPRPEMINLGHIDIFKLNTSGPEKYSKIKVKHASQSSFYIKNNALASNTIKDLGKNPYDLIEVKDNGITKTVVNTDYSHERYVHTGKGDDSPWIKLDLDGGHLISHIIIHNRTNCCNYRILGARICLLDKTGEELQHQTWGLNRTSKSDKLNTTISGYKCQKWSKNFPHKHTRGLVKKILIRANDEIITHYMFKSTSDSIIKKSGKPIGNYEDSVEAPKGQYITKIKVCKNIDKQANESDILGISEIFFTNQTSKKVQWGDWKNAKTPLIYELGYRGADHLIKSGIGNHNFCRNPDKESHLWCYTENPNKRWEFCSPRLSELAQTQKDKYSTDKYSLLDWRHYPGNKGKKVVGDKSFSSYKNEDPITDPWAVFEFYNNTGFKNADPLMGATYIKIGNNIYIRGVVEYYFSKSIPKNTIIDILPENVRPKYRKIFNVTDSNRKNCRVDITENGKVICVSGSETSKISLFGISYPDKTVKFEPISLYTNYFESINNEDMNINNVLADNRIVKNLSYNSNLEKPRSMAINSLLNRDCTISVWLKPVKNGRQNFVSIGQIDERAYLDEGVITLEPGGTLSYYYGIKRNDCIVKNGTRLRNGVYIGFYSRNKIPWGKWSHVALVRHLTKRDKDGKRKPVLQWYINGSLDKEGNNVLYKDTSETKCKIVEGGRDGDPNNSKHEILDANSENTGNISIGRGYATSYKGEFSKLNIWSKALEPSTIRILGIDDPSSRNNLKYSKNYGPVVISMDKSEDGRTLVSLQGVMFYKNSVPSGNQDKLKLNNKQLEPEYRPNSELTFLTNQNRSHAIISITPEGDIFCYDDNKAAGFISLDGISYYTNK